MKQRTYNKRNKKKDVEEIVRFNDLKSFLTASFNLSRNIVVKKDILTTIQQLETNGLVAVR